MKERVFTIISQNPNISGNELARKTQFVRKRERQEIIEDLLEAKRIVRIEKGHGYCYAVKE
jgi:predicted Zn-ribbon and HTH transcriptional regulator